MDFTVSIAARLCDVGKARTKMWNASGRPLVPIRPNSSNVLPFGVAVKAKKLRFGRSSRLHHLVQPVFPVWFGFPIFGNHGLAQDCLQLAR